MRRFPETSVAAIRNGLVSIEIHQYSHGTEFGGTEGGKSAVVVRKPKELTNPTILGNMGAPSHDVTTTQNLWVDSDYGLGLGLKLAGLYHLLLNGLCTAGIGKSKY